MRAVCHGALLLSCLASQGCFMTSSLWQRERVRVEHGEQRLVAIEPVDEGDPGRSNSLRMTTIDRVAAADCPDLLRSGSTHRLELSLSGHLGTLMDPWADLGAGGVEILGLRRYGVPTDDHAWGADLRLRGRADLEAIGTILPAAAITHLGTEPMPRAGYADAIDDVDLRHLVECIAPETERAAIRPLAWTHADLARDADPPRHLAAASDLEIFDQRLVVAVTCDPPLWVAVSGPGILVADRCRWYPDADGIAWEVEATGRVRVTVDDGPPVEGPSAWMGIESWRIERPPHSALGIAGRVVATPVTLAADSVLVAAGMILLPLVFAGY